MLLDDPRSETIVSRAATVRDRVDRAAARAGRPAAAITLIAVTKTLPSEKVREAARAGIADVGENKVQEAAAKIAELADLPSLHWHLIGHLQRNKARRAAELFRTIHSVDSSDLATALAEAPRGGGRVLEAFLQVNISGEASKSGFSPEALRASAGALASLPNLRWRGLMTIAPADADEVALRAVFAATRALHRELGPHFGSEHWNALSMGMSDDFETAIEEGATHIRVGRAIFGERTVTHKGVV